MKDFANDSIMLSALSAGIDEAFDALFVKYYAKVLGFVSNFCSDRQESENIVQDLFMTIWIKRERFVQIENIDNYLFISARNAACKYIKRSLQFDDISSIAEKRSNGTDASTKVCYNELYNMVMREIATMPQQRRKVFLMSREEGLTNAEIAIALGISKRTVETHISLALVQMKKVFPSILLLTLIN